MNKKLFVIPVVVILAVVIAVVVWPRGGTAVKKHDAVKDFRQGSSKSDESKSDEKSGEVQQPVSIPAKGVYTFAAVGQEEVKLGPVPADTRIFPTEIVASVKEPAAAADGSTTTTAKADKASGVDTGSVEKCFDYELSLLAEHIEKTTYCASVSGKGDKAVNQLRIAAHTMQMKMGPANPVATLTCDPELVISEGANLSDIKCSLVLGGGPMEVNADMTGSLTVGAPEAIDVGGTAVQARPVAINYVASGKVSGPWSETIWMAVDDWLPVKIVREINLRGPANIRETSELNLKSLEPTT
ncbi:MAG: hypothetical protein R2735_05745 [Microthrixaceae bacterium]